MKILMLSVLAPDTSDVPLFVKRALEGFGHRVVMVCPDEDTTLLESVLHNTQRRFTWLDLWAFSRRVFKTIKAHKPDILLVYGSNFYVLPSFLRKIKQRFPIKILLWEGNIQFWRWFQAEALQYYDICFVADSYAIPILSGPAQKARVHYLVGGADPQEHKPLQLTEADSKRYGSDIAFVGGGWPERIKLFEGLVNYDVKLWGHLWNRSEKLKEFQRDEPVYGLKKTKIYNASKICLNMQNPVSQINGISCRVFEILACGGFPLSEYRKDIELNFRIGEEVEVFRDEKELTAKIDYYLAHPEERLEIVRKGRERVLREHTYKHRMEEMLRIINAHS